LGLFGDAVAAAGDGFEGKAVFAHFFHATPDADAADTEGVGEGVTGHKSVFSGEEGTQYF